MPRTIHCRFLDQQAEGLDRKPLPGELGQHVLDNISNAAWQKWLAHHTMLINKKCLNPIDPEHRSYLIEQAEAFHTRIGAYQDRQEAERRRCMAGTGVDDVRQGDNITLNMPGAITFGFDSPEVQPPFRPVLDNLPATLIEYRQTVIEADGHTDSVGAAEYNQRLSERRAAAVTGYRGGRGVMRDRMIVVGAGQNHPIASNATEAGRAQTRRGEITPVQIGA